MSKKVSAREFLHGFAELQKDLRPGESVTITRHGQTVGEFTKKSTAPKTKLPDFKKDASKAGFDTKVGDAVLARLLKDEAVS
jgi:antitoxin (DNA-binding transcriptional repressor) of toxin-antitoxin stability system